MIDNVTNRRRVSFGLDDAQEALENHEKDNMSLN